MLLILEGIHALNPMLTKDIPEENKFKIYASALTTILLDDHNYIPTTFAPVGMASPAHMASSSCTLPPKLACTLPMP